MSYCGECAEWVGSGSVNDYGERWCPYSRRYERSDQRTYGCRGFIEADRAVITRVCLILGRCPRDLFSAFDEVKSSYLKSERFEDLVNYYLTGPKYADAISRSEDPVGLSRDLYDRYLVPCRELTLKKEYEAATSLYERMLEELNNII